MEKEIINLVEENGPLTGAELLAALGGDSLALWKACELSDKLLIRIIGARYLRLDRAVDGFARLSPSILREFLTYSVVGLENNRASIERRHQGITGFLLHHP